MVNGCGVKLGMGKHFFYLGAKGTRGEDLYEFVIDSKTNQHWKDIPCGGNLGADSPRGCFAFCRSCAVEMGITW